MVVVALGHRNHNCIKSVPCILFLNKWYNYTIHAEINARSSQAKVANSIFKMLFKTVAWLLC